MIIKSGSWLLCAMSCCPTRLIHHYCWQRLPFTRRSGVSWARGKSHGLRSHSKPFLGLPPAESSEKLVEIFQQTPLGRFLAQLHAEQQQELLQCYLQDFLLLTMRVSTWGELKVNPDPGTGAKLVWCELDANVRTLLQLLRLVPSCLWTSTWSGRTLVPEDAAHGLKRLCLRSSAHHAGPPKTWAFY